MAEIFGMFILLYMYHMVVDAVTHVDVEYDYYRSRMLSAGVSICLWAAGCSGRAVDPINF